MSAQSFHIFIKPGDAGRELAGILEELGAATPEQAGCQKSIYVTRADQTVVFATGREAPIARALREREGWQEPEP